MSVIPGNPLIQSFLLENFSIWELEKCYSQKPDTSENLCTLITDPLNAVNPFNQSLLPVRNLYEAQQHTGQTLVKADT